MSRLATLLIILVVGCAPLLAGDGVGAAPKPGRGPHRLETGRLDTPAAKRVMAGGPSAKDRYIVVLKDAVGDPRRAAERLATDGVVPTHVYRHVFKGFAALIPPGRLAALKRDPNVVSVTPDGIVRATAEVAGLPTGVDRIDADQNTFAKIDDEDTPGTRVDVDVAILDTGSGPHPDLNLWAVANCTTEASLDDVDGHGTHVAGIVGALDNGTGVVGVAPGARIWSVKVLAAGGPGMWSWIECGLDIVTAYAPGTADPLGDIEVANMSLAGAGRPDDPGDRCGFPGYPTHFAVCRAVEAGVTVVVGAGNNAQDAKGFIPASYDEVITVSALADSDGKPGGNGPATSGGPDDTFWRNPAVAVGTNGAGSNFGADVDLAAPGVDIWSTVPTSAVSHSDPSGYKVLGGTSMASPHVAGAAALYIAEHGRVGPAAIKDGLLAQAEHFALGIPGDPDGMAEGVVSVKMPDTTPPEVTIIAPIGGARVRTGVVIKLFATDTQSGVKSVAVRFCAGTTCSFAAGKLIGTDTTTPYTVKWRTQPRNGTYTLVAKATDKAGNTKLSAPVTVRVKN